MTTEASRRGHFVTDPVFDAIGTTFSEAFSLFKERNIYLNAISDPANEEIVVTMTESSLCLVQDLRSEAAGRQ